MNDDFIVINIFLRFLSYNETEKYKEGCGKQRNGNFRKYCVDAIKRIKKSDFKDFLEKELENSVFYKIQLSLPVHSWYDRTISQ